MSIRSAGSTTGGLRMFHPCFGNLIPNILRLMVVGSPVWNETSIHRKGGLGDFYRTTWDGGT
ncbi:MAG: hypothetical protein IPP29_23755 [Bacteroidetes bacterium]|nr:hypothetical protein [Bacteroidota bacterium]